MDGLTAAELLQEKVFKLGKEKGMTEPYSWRLSEGNLLVLSQSGTRVIQVMTAREVRHFLGR